MRNYREQSSLPRDAVLFCRGGSQSAFRRYIRTLLDSAAPEHGVWRHSACALHAEYRARLAISVYEPSATASRHAILSKALSSGPSLIWPGVIEVWAAFLKIPVDASIKIRDDKKNRHVRSYQSKNTIGCFSLLEKSDFSMLDFIMEFHGTAKCVDWQINLCYLRYFKQRYGRMCHPTTPTIKVCYSDKHTWLPDLLAKKKEKKEKQYPWSAQHREMTLNKIN